MIVANGQQNDVEDRLMRFGDGFAEVHVCVCERERERERERESKSKSRREGGREGARRERESVVCVYVCVV